MRKFVVICLIASAICLFKARCDDRINVDITVNGKPVKLSYDTGSNGSVLFRGTVERLGLKIVSKNLDAKAIPLGQTRIIGVTEQIALDCGGKSQKVGFPVIDKPSSVIRDVDGVLSWRDLDLPQNEVLLIDVPKKHMAYIPLPGDIKKWKKWHTVHGRHSATMDASWMPVDGLLVQDVFRAGKISIGGLSFNDMPVTVQNPAEIVTSRNSDATIGLFALEQMKLIIDLRNNVIYTHPVSNSSIRYDYNRLGAVFVPGDPKRSNDLVAHVALNSPAAEAGIRDDDVLLKIDDLDVTQWRTDSKILPLSRFWTQAPGTKLKLSLKHNEEPYEVTITLKDPDPVD